MTSLPSTIIFPEVGVSKPAIIRKSVDFPEPEAPTAQTNSEVSTCILISFRATTDPRLVEKDLLRLVISKCMIVSFLNQRLK